MILVKLISWKREIIQGKKHHQIKTCLSFVIFNLLHLLFIFILFIPFHIFIFNLSLCYIFILILFNLLTGPEVSMVSSPTYIKIPLINQSSLIFFGKDATIINSIILAKAKLCGDYNTISIAEYLLVYMINKYNRVSTCVLLVKPL